MPRATPSSGGAQRPAVHGESDQAVPGLRHEVSRRLRSTSAAQGAVRERGSAHNGLPGYARKQEGRASVFFGAHDGARHRAGCQGQRLPREERSGLPCTVSPIKPFLGFDMKFHAGYEVLVPLKELSGNEDLLTTVFRVTHENKKDEPVYFSARMTVPAIEPDAKGNAYL